MPMSLRANTILTNRGVERPHSGAIKLAAPHMDVKLHVRGIYWRSAVTLCPL
jgi:hypothetical protein